MVVAFFIAAHFAELLRVTSHPIDCQEQQVVAAPLNESVLSIQPAYYPCGRIGRAEF
jgi:hypothetical protein